ncbi:hypothetical protein C1H46_018778 [Malus baccata]|uniref:Uncharacterized protein n=1 Tax=Malus baccata TaxID=106549 RepID=A0A540MA55_MALBA|nr:hypothetical protein C1H46_018778 [Malus baccata]
MILIHSALSNDTRTVVDSVELELTNMDLKSISSRSLPDPHTLRKSSHLIGPKVLQVLTPHKFFFLYVYIFFFLCVSNRWLNMRFFIKYILISGCWTMWYSILFWILKEGRPV